MARKDVIYIALGLMTILGGCGPSNNFELPGPIDYTGQNMQVARRGRGMTLLGEQRNVGDNAPQVTMLNNRYAKTPLAKYQGKVILISTVPQLGTEVCDRSTRELDAYAARANPNVEVITISTDDPFTQARWAAEHDVRNHPLLSDFPDKRFGQAYGVLVKQAGYLARCTFVIDRSGIIRYIELQREMSLDPNLDAAIALAEQLAVQ